MFGHDQALSPTSRTGTLSRLRDVREARSLALIDLLRRNRLVQLLRLRFLARRSVPVIEHLEGQNSIADKARNEAI